MSARKKKGKQGVSRKSKRAPKQLRRGWTERIDGRTCDGRAINSRLRDLRERYGAAQFDDDGDSTSYLTTPEQEMLFRSLIGVEGMRIRLDAEVREHERKGRKLSTFQGLASYTSTIDRINSVIRQLEATMKEKKAQAVSEHATDFSAALERATRSYEMEPAPKREAAKAEAPPAPPPEPQPVPATPPIEATPQSPPPSPEERRAQMALVATKER